MMKLFVAALALTMSLSPICWGQNPFYGDISDLKLLKAEDAKDMASMSPPKGAIVLYDGKNFDKWIHRDGKTDVKWKIQENGAMQVEPRATDIITRGKFDGKFKLHVEFRVPYQPGNKGQGRGNSGVYVQGRYEIQVLDSYGVEKIGMGDCGAIYGVAIASKNACKAPTVWQSYDIEFESPKCENGKKVAPGIMTVYHNGIKIHDRVKITSDNTTSGMGGDVCEPGPILLQDHGDPVQYRNVWLLPAKD